MEVFFSSRNNSSRKEDMALETVVPGRHQYPDLVFPEPLHIPSGMAHAQFHAMGTTISLLLPAEHLWRGEEIVRTLFAIYSLSVMLVGILLWNRLMKPVNAKSRAHPILAIAVVIAVEVGAFLTIIGPLQPGWNAVANLLNHIQH
jgi:hypothetical protein